MSNSRGRRSRSNEPEWQAVRLLAIGGSVAIFQCSICGEVHIHHMEPLFSEALQHVNEEGPPRSTATLHDHSLELATESNNDHDI